ncbi:MAG: hypothetical protein FJX65_08940 [Alphaproteobacteria bacterium]|nr:hypothetical protein [Alphaproteobacteria bacterium]
MADNPLTLNFVADDVARQRLTAASLGKAVRLLDGLGTLSDPAGDRKAIAAIRGMVAAAVTDLESNARHTETASRAFVEHMSTLIN